MAFVSRCAESFTFKYMTQVSTACCTCNFNSSPIRVRITVYGTGQSLIKSRPATPRIEFGSGSIKRSPTSCAVVDTFFKELIIFPSAWVLFIESCPRRTRTSSEFSKWKEKLDVWVMVSIPKFVLQLAIFEITYVKRNFSHLIVPLSFPTLKCKRIQFSLNIHRKSSGLPVPTTCLWYF